MAEPEQVRLLDTYLQRICMSAPVAASLLYEEHSGPYPKPYIHKSGQKTVEIGIRDSAYQDYAVFYIKNCATGTVRLLKLVCMEVTAPGRGGAAHGASNSGRADWGHGANPTAAPHGRGGGGRGVSEYHVSFDPL